MRAVNDDKVNDATLTSLPRTGYLDDPRPPRELLSLAGWN